MSRFWENRTDGRQCLVIDPEDGTHPLRIYGQTQEEVLDKAAKTIEHGQRTIASLRTQSPQNGSGNGNGHTRPTNAPQSQPAPRRSLTADEQMAFTSDLSNPAKSPEAIARLVEHATGLDLRQLQRDETIRRVSEIQLNWQRTHPEFPEHPANIKMLNDSAALRVGYANITHEVMEQVYQDLLNAGMLLPAQERNEQPDNGQQTTPTLRPDESPVSRSYVRPRGASSYQRNALRSPVPTGANPTAKYTRAQVDQMPADTLRKKIESEPGFAQLLETYAQAPRSGT